MKKLFLILVTLFAVALPLRAQIEIPPALKNASSTGTSVGHLVKLTGAPSTAIIAATADTNGIIGICDSNCGTSNFPNIATAGVAICAFDAATTAGDYVQISTITAGDCHDTGSSTPPTSGQVIGRVLQTISSADNASVLLVPAGQSSGGGGSSILLQTNGTNNGSQSQLNQAAGANISITDDGIGDVTTAVTGVVPAPQSITTPSTPRSVPCSLVQSTGVWGFCQLALNDLDGSTASAASTPALSITGPVTTGGTGTTNTPHIYFNQGVTQPSTWNVNGTWLGMNAVSGYTGNFLDFHVNGASSVFSVSSGGSPTIAGGAVFTWLGLSKIRSNADGTLQFGNNINNAFTRLQFGGTTSAFPALCFPSPLIFQICAADGTTTNGAQTVLSSPGNKVFVTTNFTTDGVLTTLQPITGLTFNFPAQAQNWRYSCDLSYQIATGTAAVAFGIQAATNAPTAIYSTGTQQISAGPPSTYVSQTLGSLNTTTATNIVSGTPGTTGVTYTVHLGGTLQLTGTTNAVKIMVSTATAADIVTVFTGGGCQLF